MSRDWKIGDQLLLTATITDLNVTSYKLYVISIDGNNADLRTYVNQAALDLAAYLEPPPLVLRPGHVVDDAKGNRWAIVGCAVETELRAYPLNPDLIRWRALSDLAGPLAVVLEPKL